MNKHTKNKQICMFQVQRISKDVKDIKPKQFQNFLCFEIYQTNSSNVNRNNCFNSSFDIHQSLNKRCCQNL